MPFVRVPDDSQRRLCEDFVVQISDILETIQTYSPDADLEPVMQAYLLAAQAHAGQMRKSGEPYLSHPLEVANILALMRMDIDTIATALLHDALEDNPITKQEMAALVGPVVTELVDGVTKIGKLKYRSKEELQAENFRKMMMAMSRDLRVILVKLADRLHNMRTLDGHKEEKRRKISKETMEVYVPIANRLGITRLKAELEDLCVMYLEPELYRNIDTYLNQTQADREAYTGRVCAALEKEMQKVHVEGKVSGRAKARSSILKKLKRSSIDVSQVPDLLAFRIVVSDLSACYLMLGTIHTAYAPVPGRIKDYIARPKPNGYQSLHTTVVGPEGRAIEVQIRTEEMHRFAEDGIAAHWRYKEGHLALNPEDVVKISRIRDAFESAQETDDPAEFMETVKVEFYADEVFVFTPQGEVKTFPLGSSPLDFAYAIHTDIGEHCVGARVDGRIVPLHYKLSSGDTIEILTNPNQRPNRGWLDIAKTGRALSKIRRTLRQAEEETAIKMGSEILTAELTRFEWTLARFRTQDRVEDYVKARKLRNFDQLLVEIARGHISPGDLAKAGLPDGVWISRQEEARRNRLSSLFNRFSTRKAQSPVLITGEDGVLVNFAKCCNPLPGEEVVGFITRGRGITVHREDCHSLRSMEEDRFVSVRWDLSTATRHSNTLRITCDDRPGVLAKVTKLCELAKINIEKVDASTQKNGESVMRLQLAVKDLGELTRMIRNVEKIPGIHGVKRVTGS